MKPIATFDVETDPFKRGRVPLPFACDFFDGQRHRVFWGHDCIARAFAVMRRFPGYIYAHNGGKFDFKYLLPFVDPEEVVIKLINGRLAKFKAGAAEFRDSYCLLPVPLKAIGKLEIDYRKLEAGVRHRWREEIIRYLKHDCESLRSAVVDFVEEYGFGLTLAGRTFAQLKKRFRIDPPRTNKFHDQIFRPFYYGGRVQFFRLGKLPGVWRIFDINSAYPFAMRDRHPFGLEFETRRALPRKDRDLGPCFLHLQGVSKGGLPWKQADGSLSFAPHAGEFYVTGWEFAAARDLGLIEAWQFRRIYFPLSCRDFSEFVDYFYTLKRRADKGSREEVAAKLLLNSCYGKFGQNPENYCDYRLVPYGDEPEENRERRLEGEDPLWRLVNDFEDQGLSLWEKQVAPDETAYYNVATAASITGWVRAYLMRSLARVRDPVYCDTDSIICRDGEGLSLGADLGQWKEEGRTVRGGLWIAGKKLYAARLAGGGWKTAAKGVRLDPQEICRIAEGEGITHEFEAPSFSLKTGEHFITRKVVRDDMRKRR